MRKPIVAGNWKMHLTRAEAEALASDVRRLTARARSVEVVLIPPFPYLVPVSTRLEGSGIALGAQDCDARDKGAFTGGVSAPMLASVGCSYVLVGHSERRRTFGDTDQVVNEKLHAVRRAGLVPILCIGETREERAQGSTLEVLNRQIDIGLAGLDAEAVAGLVLAYEPVWAIGTGEVATPEQAQDAHAAIRERLAQNFGAATAAAVRIQYGGSVKADNAGRLMRCPDIDGALVGGASLSAEEFAGIVFFDQVH